LFDDFDALLERHPLPQGFTAEYPISGNALRHMHAGPSEKNLLLGSCYQELARSIVGGTWRLPCL
jgi:hypothetical protein